MRIRKHRIRLESRYYIWLNELTKKTTKPQNLSAPHSKDSWGTYN